MIDQSEFDKWAGSYDERVTTGADTFPFCGYYDVLGAVVSIAKVRPGMRVLDIGIGTGLLSEALSKQGCDICGVDFSEKMLERARARLPVALLATVDVARDYLGRFSQDRFDRIVSSYFLHHLDRDAQVSLISRAVTDNLLPGGMILIADVGFENEAAYAEAHERHRAAWDEAEHYLCGERIVAGLQAEGVAAEYIQISECSGVLRCSAQTG